MLLDFFHFDDFLLFFTTGVNFVPFVSYHLVSVNLCTRETTSLFNFLIVVFPVHYVAAVLRHCAPDGTTPPKKTSNVLFVFCCIASHESPASNARRAPFCP